MSIKLIIVLGYTLNRDCSIQPILQSRLDKAILLYQKEDNILVCGNGPPKALVPEPCQKTTEAEAMKNYLIAKGIPAEKIYKEEQSTTTFGNAYYGYLTIKNNKLFPKSIFIISNQFHFPLVKYSFDKVFGNSFSYSFHAVSDVDLPIEKEMTEWKRIIQGMVDNCYPQLFNGVNDGDIDAITSIIERPRNNNFERCVKTLLNLKEENVDLSDFI
ncbi:YdcF family protein [Legionella oakridgensis]|uniref:DUF218 domain-containing protein n=2 Tax=Legionella oakridgensis TaxID=29423 RepID=W0B7N0_9GAMM|nr:YdcF family protein [Legionella oakridgensis]AHE65850.1 hypothetical protein Loa_00261 [Legionella oakridgensis ATCC 33761 = DSM 21215]KTD37302.1 hypothetical protein Loak_2438 [Legionella oakridgensis]STY15786.1 DUF218 domain [Legionella longbeachae]